jgi:hypothetical protein
MPKHCEGYCAARRCAKSPGSFAKRPRRPGAFFRQSGARIGHRSLVHKPMAWGCIVGVTLLGASRDGPCTKSPCRVRRSPRHTKRPLPQDPPRLPRSARPPGRGRGCHGQATASAETFDPPALTAARRMQRASQLFAWELSCSQGAPRPMEIACAGQPHVSPTPARGSVDGQPMQPVHAQAAIQEASCCESIS